MFTKAKNIDTTFRQFRLFCFLITCCSSAITCFTIYRSISVESSRNETVLILPTGKVVEAVTTDRKENLSAEIRDHIRTFHEYFFWLEPDDRLIQSRISRALYLADGSAKREYENLKESGFYTNIISGNVTQRITIDSIQVSNNGYPYTFRCFARLEITRPTTVALRNLVTEGRLREVKRSNLNSHGFLIENWSVTENRDISVKQR